MPTATEPKLRVLIVAHDVHSHGGMERAFFELIEQGRGEVDFVVLSSTLGTELRPYVSWRRLPTPARPFPLKFLWFFLLAPLMRRRLDVDLVHTCGAIAPMAADLASVHFCHRGYVEKTGRLSPAGAPRLRQLNTTLTRLISLAAESVCFSRTRLRSFACVSSGVEEEVRKAYPRIPSTITPNGVDLERFHPRDREREALRSTEGVTSDDVVVLFVGGDWDRKGLGLALEAFAIACSRTLTGLHLWVVGSGDVERYLELASRLGVDDRVRFFGRRADTERFYASSDVLVFPTLYEAFPLVALEAAATGIPVIGTCVNGLSELVGAGGGVLSERTPQAFADALRRLADDPVLRATLGSTGRAWVSEFTWSRSADSVLRLYRQLAGASVQTADRSS